MTERISSADAKAHFAKIVTRVAEARACYVIERRGKPLAAVVSIDDLNILDKEPRPAERTVGMLALVGAWRDIPDEEIDSLVRDIYTERERDKGRPVDLTS